MEGLAGKVALITGAQRGIGAAIARHLAGEGASVWVNAVEELHQAETLAGEIGGRAVEGDVTDQAQVEAMLEQSGPLDVLVNNAADQTRQPILETDPAAWGRTLAVNVTGPMLLIRAAAPAMEPGAAIVNVASVHSVVALRDAAAYTASKGALLMLTRQAAVELAERGIRVNAVAPGAIDITGDELQRQPGGDSSYAGLPLRRAGTPEEVAAVVAFLASGEASYVTGATYVADGGLLVRDPWGR
ncbi:MAG: SDR family oxidoreductase [Actinomycetota bacterium]|nr:SDR family oxidoreductase [Actinomycetota bacterium]